jgi:hypothetical protein
MSWLFSQALAVECSLGTSLDGEPYAQLNATPTPHRFWRNDRTMEFSDLSRFGLTSRVLTEDHGEALLTSYLAGFPVKTSAPQVRVRASTESAAGSGVKWHGSFAKYDRDSSSWKTAQCSLLGDSDEFSETWPRWGLMLDGECWEDTTSEPPTVENESGFLPTPRASVGTHGICWARAKTGEHRSQLEDFLGWLSLNHGGQVVSGRTVNSDFQDWLMAWPTQWTDLRPLETDKFQSWLRQHSPSCLAETEAA